MPIIIDLNRGGVPNTERESFPVSARFSIDESWHLAVSPDFRLSARITEQLVASFYRFL